MIDPAGVAAETGWRIHAHRTLASTNDEAARLRDGGAAARTVVVAEEQTRGRGRGGAVWASPPGGLYASLLVAARPDDLPGWLVAALALAGVEAIGAASGVPCRIKWPNDLWVGERKVGGILCEASGADLPVVAGFGINVRGVPGGLSGPGPRPTALDAEGGRAVGPAGLLVALLRAVDRRAGDLADPARRRHLARQWRAALLHLGGPIGWRLADGQGRGVLRDASPERGLLVEEGPARTRWLAPGSVREVRPLPAGGGEWP